MGTVQSDNKKYEDSEQPTQTMTIMNATGSVNSIPVEDIPEENNVQCDSPPGEPYQCLQPYNEFDDESVSIFEGVDSSYENAMRVALKGIPPFACNPIGSLYEYCAINKYPRPELEIISATAVTTSPQVTYNFGAKCVLRLDNSTTIWSEGFAGSKKVAKKIAAQGVYNCISTYLTPSRKLSLADEILRFQAMEENMRRVIKTESNTTTSEPTDFPNTLSKKQKRKKRKNIARKNKNKMSKLISEFMNM